LASLTDAQQPEWSGRLDATYLLNPPTVSGPNLKCCGGIPTITMVKVRQELINSANNVVIMLKGQWLLNCRLSNPDIRTWIQNSRYDGRKLNWMKLARLPVAVPPIFFVSYIFVWRLHFYLWTCQKYALPIFNRIAKVEWVIYNFTCNVKKVLTSKSCFPVRNSSLVHSIGNFSKLVLKLNTTFLFRNEWMRMNANRINTDKHSWRKLLLNFTLAIYLHFMAAKIPF